MWVINPLWSNVHSFTLGVSGIRFTLTEAAVERLESREQRELGASPGGLVGRLEKT